MFREAKEKQDAKERHWKVSAHARRLDNASHPIVQLHLAGKTDEAKSDLARLQKIKAEREAALAKRMAEAEGLYLPCLNIDSALIASCSQSSRGRGEAEGSQEWQTCLIFRGINRMYAVLSPPHWYCFSAVEVISSGLASYLAGVE